MEVMPRGLLDKILHRVKVDRRTGCWIYTGSLVGKCNYGSIWTGKRNIHVHRAMWIIGHNEPLGRWDFVCHKCDVGPCCNPTHLWLGTLAENNRDMANKGRYNHQKKTHCAQGHEFTPDNIYRAPSRPNKRACKTCSRIRQREVWHTNPRRRALQNQRRRERVARLRAATR